MSSIQRLAVSPKLPTILADQTHVDLLGHDISDLYVRTVHVILTKLDVSRFEDALSRVLQLYPHVAGKFRHIDRRWVIELTNTAIPLDLENKLGSSSSSFLNGNWVVQDDFSPFIDVNPFTSGVLDDCTPLLVVKLTFFDHETCIGLAWHHSLGDATVHTRFLHTLSQFYQGLPAEFATPSFQKYQFPTPSDSVVAEIWPHIPRFHKACDFGESPASIPRCEHVRWHIDDRDIEELHSVLSSKKQNGLFLSKQDCITAYLVAVLNSTRSDPVQSVRNVSSYRHIKAPFIAENEASNLLMDVIADVPVDMAGIATAVRKAFIQCQDPDYLHSWLSVTSNIVLETYRSGKNVPFLTLDDQFTVNSVTKIDLHSAHFGCPGTQYYLEGVIPNLARVTRSNPVKGVDGVWQTRRSVEISMGVAPEAKAKVLEILALGVRYMLKDERARL